MWITSANFEIHTNLESTNVKVASKIRGVVVAGNAAVSVTTQQIYPMLV